MVTAHQFLPPVSTDNRIPKSPSLPFSHVSLVTIANDQLLQQMPAPNH